MHAMLLMHVKGGPIYWGMTTGAPVEAERSINKPRVGVRMLGVHKKGAVCRSCNFCCAIGRELGPFLPAQHQSEPQWHPRCARQGSSMLPSPTFLLGSCPQWWPCSADILDAVWQRGWASFPSIGRVLWFRGYKEAPLAAAYAMCRLGVNGSCCSGTLELTAFIKASVLRCLKSATNSWCWHRMKRPVSSLLSAAVNAVPANSKPLKIHFVLAHKALKSEWF